MKMNLFALLCALLRLASFVYALVALDSACVIRDTYPYKPYINCNELVYNPPYSIYRKGCPSMTSPFVYFIDYRYSSLYCISSDQLANWANVTGLNKCVPITPQIESGSFLKEFPLYYYLFLVAFLWFALSLLLLLIADFAVTTKTELSIRDKILVISFGVASFLDGLVLNDVVGIANVSKPEFCKNQNNPSSYYGSILIKSGLSAMPVELSYLFVSGFCSILWFLIPNKHKRFNLVIFGVRITLGVVFVCYLSTLTSTAFSVYPSLNRFLQVSTFVSLGLISVRAFVIFSVKEWLLSP